mmetsp:Transcript_33777/g.61237  ORF Transcript_33777/g.61237 Transcript_33777/m.61237 type:complete len:461 (+) Transcript_33777:43-1425(+)
MSVADLKRLVHRATPRTEDVRAPDRNDIIRREHGHLAFREVAASLDALEFSVGSFMRQFREFQKLDLKDKPPPAPKGVTEGYIPEMSDDTAVHALFRLMDSLQVLRPAIPASTSTPEEDLDEECATNPKSGWEEVVMEARAKGAESFKKKDFAAAIEHYTDAIKASPKDFGSELHTLYSNRSAARLQVGEVKAALADARWCVKLAQSWPKGHFRKGSCLRQIGRLEEAILAFSAGQQLEPENKDWAKEVDKTDKLLCATTTEMIKQLVFLLLPDILAAWDRVGEPDGVLQLQVNGTLDELGACKWRQIREGHQTGKAQIRYAFLQKKGYLANLAANLQSSAPEGFATVDLEGGALKIPDIAAFVGNAGTGARALIHFDMKTSGKMAAFLIALPLEDGLKRFITKPKDPDPPKGSVDSVLGLQRKSGFPKSYPRYLGFQMFPGDLNFPVIDLLRDAPGSID